MSAHRKPRRFQWPAWLLDWSWRQQATPHPDDPASHLAIAAIYLRGAWRFTRNLWFAMLADDQAPTLVRYDADPTHAFRVDKDRPVDRNDPDTWPVPVWIGGKR